MLDFLQIDPVAFRIPIGDGFQIYWYGIIVTLGIALGGWWAGREIARRNQNVDEFYNGLIIAVIAGYVFARLTFVILDIIDGRGSQYDTLGAVLNIRAGGVNILGGFAGAALVATAYVRWRKLRFWHYADVAGPALLLAQAIGRWGNFINQELYGPPTDLPWGILIDLRNRLFEYSDVSQYPAETRFHPTFLYESIALLLGFFLLTWLNKRYADKWKPGTLFGIFMIWWAGNRAWVELFRPDQPAIGETFITYSMLASLALVIAGVVVLLSRYDKLPNRPKPKRRKRRTLKPKPRRDQAS